MRIQRRSRPLPADGSGGTALFYAIVGGHAETMRSLVEQGGRESVRLGPVASYRGAPLSAANQGQADVVAVLIEYGADIDARTRSGETASDLAWGDAVTEATLERGAATAP